MQKRAIHSRSPQPAWVESDRRGAQEPVGPMLTALGPVVYAVRTKDNLIKIGCTTDLARRCHQVGPGMKSILAWRAGTRADELAIHTSLNGLAVRGREWYPWHPAVIGVINEMRADLGITPISSPRAA